METKAPAVDEGRGEAALDGAALGEAALGGAGLGGTPMSALDAYNVFRQNCPSRQVFDLVGERWTGLVLLALHGQCQRFAALRRQIEGISQKMLTQTLRRLEHDGLVNRRAFATVPVTVEYSLTPLGESLCEVIETLRTWAYSHAGELTAAHQKYVTENG
jgi:DNA-binding HxlR family transcriptional regulator